jgi:hypothetical protein
MGLSVRPFKTTIAVNGNDQMGRPKAGKLIRGRPEAATSFFIGGCGWN